MKFIHTADLHLASPFQGLTDIPHQLWQQVHMATFAAFKKIVTAAIDEDVDFMLIVGDVFDREQKSIAAIDFFVAQLQRLSMAGIPVFLSYGNHDFNTGTDQQIDLPANVRVFGPTVSTKHLTINDGNSVAITGFSYARRWVDENIAASFPVKKNTDWQIGMLHGAQYQAGGSNHYAPFTLDELRAKHYNYWALGHIHKHQLLNAQPPIVYSGIPQGRHKNEGGQHGYYLVESCGRQLVPSFKPLDGIEWTKAAVNLSTVTNPQALARVVTQAGTKLAVNNLTLVSFQLENIDHLSAECLALLRDGTLLNHLQGQLARQGQIKWWPYELSIAPTGDLPKLTDLDQRFWADARQAVFTPENIARVAQPLLRQDVLFDQFGAELAPEKLYQLAKQVLGGINGEN